MKKLAYILLFPFLIGTSSMAKAQYASEAYLGLPGDNLNLFAVMKLFQESETLEGFERSLNDENSMINNLDLNGDNRIDYIRVIDNPEREVHVIVLQVAINAWENQDVAVFVVEREAHNQVRIQLIGDEALYGKNYIVEPNYNTYGQYYSETPNPGYTGYAGGQPVVVNHVTTYEVAAWPLVRFIFWPGYVVWRSPWYWGYYPYWWHAWHPYYWHYYYGYHSHWYPDYYSCYRYSHHHYDNHWDTYYRGSRRNFSPYVTASIKAGSYKTTYSRPESRRAGSEQYTKTYGAAASRSATRVSGNTQAKSTTDRPTTINEYRRREATPRIETKKSSASDSHVNSASSRRSSETAVNQPSVNKAGSSKSTVQAVPRSQSANRGVSNSSGSRKTTASSQVKSKGSASSVNKETADRAHGTSGGRR
jgi:hypothetical protein